jgi:hypothetical protein
MDKQSLGHPCNKILPPLKWRILDTQNVDAEGKK